MRFASYQPRLGSYFKPNEYPGGLQVITLIDTEAGGYAELAYGEEDFDDELVLVVTLGKAMGGVLYKQGHRVRNTGMNKTITSKWEQDLEALESRFPDAFPKTDSGIWGGFPLPAQPGVYTRVCHLPNSHV